MKVLQFPERGTGSVYDETQCSDQIAMGDVLVVPDEKVVGFLLGAWPIAVTVGHGSFHSKDPACAWDKMGQPGDKVDYALSAAKAIEVAHSLGYPVTD